MSLQATSTRTVTPAELLALADLHAKNRLLDVRTPGEFAAGRIPGSVNVPLPDLAQYADEIAASGSADLVVICESGARAGLATELLRERGHADAKVLSGGIRAWQGAGGDITAEAASAWSIERQVRLVAGSLVAGSIAASLRFPKARFLAGGVGSGLVIAALTNTCLMGTLLAKLPHNRAAAGDVRAAVAELTRG